MAAHHETRLLQDRVLADSARRGGEDAFAELYRRHAGAAWRLGHSITARADLVGPAVVHAFAATLTAPGSTPTLAGGMRVPILGSARHAALQADAAAGARPAPSAASGARSLQVFRSLPERWRSALWMIEVEGMTAADAAQVIGVPVAAAAPMVDRAWTSLREQVVRAGLRADEPLECRRTAEHLAGYVADALVERDEWRVRSHLDGCAPCRERLGALDDLAPRLRAATPPLPIGLTDEAARIWAASVVHRAGPLGLTTPSGAPVPVWIERAVAGAVAAAITLGVTGAILAGGRNRSRDENLVREAGRSVGADVGEIALGDDGLADVVLDGDGVPGGDAARQGRAAAQVGDAAGSGAPLPRSAGPPIIGNPSGPILNDPGAGSGGQGTPPPDDQGTSNPEPGADSVVQAVVGVGGVVSAGVGDQCTGIGFLGTPIGCEPDTSDAPVTVETDGSLLPPLSI